MTENDKTLLAWLYLEAAGAEDKGTENILNEIAARIEALNAENERLREALAAAYIKLSGRTEHASDCATSNAPAKDPGPCDCGPPDDLARAINVELGMARSANDDATAEWISGFHFAWKRVKAVLGETK